MSHSEIAFNIYKQSEDWEKLHKGLQLEDWSEFTRWIYSFNRQKFIETLKILFLVFGDPEGAVGSGCLRRVPREASSPFWNEDSLRKDVSSSQRVLAIKFILVGDNFRRAAANVYGPNDNSARGQFCDNILIFIHFSQFHGLLAGILI